MKENGHRCVLRLVGLYTSIIHKIALLILNSAKKHILGVTAYLALALLSLIFIWTNKIVICCTTEYE